MGGATRNDNSSLHNTVINNRRANPSDLTTPTSLVPRLHGRSEMFLSYYAAWVRGYTPTRPEHIHMNLPLTKNFCIYALCLTLTQQLWRWGVGGRKAQASPYLETLVPVGECVMFIFHVSQTVLQVLQDLFLRREK